MHRPVFSFFAVVLLLVAHNSAGQSADEILGKHFAASGQERLREVTSVRTTGTAVQMGTEVPFLQIQKRPGMMYLELDIQGERMIQAFNGSRGWSIEPWSQSGQRELRGAELANLKRMAVIDSELVDWKEKGHQVVYEGQAPVDDGGFFILKLTKEEGEVYRFYINPGSYLINRIVTLSVQDGETSEGETLLSDYREIGGVLFPFRHEMRFGGMTLMTNIINEVELDAVVDDAIFSAMPE